MTHLFYFRLLTCLKSVHIRSFSNPDLGKYGPEKTPYLDTFHAVTSFWQIFREGVTYLCCVEILNQT